MPAADGADLALLTPEPTERPCDPQHQARRDGAPYSDYEATNIYLESDDESTSVDGEEFVLVKPTMRLKYHYV